MAKTIIVTGGAGFIGSALIRHLINNTEYSIINIDKLTYAGNLESLSPIDKSDRYFFENIDICSTSPTQNPPRELYDLCTHTHTRTLIPEYS